MAFIEKRGRSYRVIFRYEGRRFTRSLHTVNKQVAENTLARLEDNLRRVNLGTLSIPEGSDVATYLLSDGRRISKRNRNSTSALSELVEAFFDHLPENSLEDSTLYGMRIHTKHLARLLGADFRIHALQFDDLQAYVDSRSRERGLRGHPVSPATIKKELRTLSSIWNWAISACILTNPLPKRRLRYRKTIEKPRFQTWQEIERTIERRNLSPDQQAALWDCLFLTRDEVEEFILYVQQMARHPFVYPMFAFAAYTGARRSELLRSQVDDIDLCTRSITIHERKRVPGKHTTRTVPMSLQLHSILVDWLDCHPGGLHTFCHNLNVAKSKTQRETFGALTKDEAVHHFRQTVRGTKWQKLRGWHVFRHSFCSNCAASGVDQRVINAWVGHCTDEMVRRYRHLIPDQQQTEIQRVFGGITTGQALP